MRALIDAANAAGGKDNVTVVYVEGERFAASQRGLTLPADGASAPSRPGRPQLVRVAILALLLLVLGLPFVRMPILEDWFPSAAITPGLGGTDARVVQPTDSIAAVLRDAAPGSEIIVEPGEYREQIILKDQVRVVSRVPHGARLRLPATVPDAQPIPAVLATNVTGAELTGFAITGDSATPLTVGIYVKDSAVTITDVEVTGATTAAVDFSGGGASTLLGSDIHDNPGAAVIVRDGASPRIAHNSFARNAGSERASGALVVEAGAAPRFFRNVFVALSPDSFVTMTSAARQSLKDDNWFVPAPQRRSGRPSSTTPPARNR